MTEKFQFNWLKAIQIGLIGGAAAVLLSLVGMVEAFNKRDIIAGVITMGQTLLFVICLSVSYAAANQVGGHDWRAKLAGGTLAGLMVASLIAGLVLLSQVVNLRPVLVNASPPLFKILTFNQKDIGLAVFYLLAAGAVIGLVAGLINSLPPRARRAVIAALLWVAVLGLLQELIRLTLNPWPQVTKAVSWMFAASKNQKDSPF
jgi:branched-chain amino acid transport system permease protein